MIHPQEARAQEVGDNAPIHGNMGAHVKTTIDLADALFQSAKHLAQQRQTTLRALVEEGLRLVLSQAQAKARPAFKLADASVQGGEMLLADPRHWLQLEDEHLTAGIKASAGAGPVARRNRRRAKPQP